MSATAEMRSEIRKGIARWYSGGGGFIDRIVSVLIVVLGAVNSPQAVRAQVFIADGTTVTASGNEITQLFALNGGVINSFDPLGIIGDMTNPVVARTGGTINIFQGSTIHAVQDALHADDAGSTITVTGTLIISSAGGALDSTGATINILGGSTVIAPLGVLASQGATFNIIGSTINSETAMVGVGPGINTINLTNSTATAIPGTLPDPFIQGAALQVFGGGTTTLNADASQITGTMLTDSVSTSTVDLSNGTVWNMTGNSNVTNLTNSASTINFTPPVTDPTALASYKTLTVTNYVGANGTIRLNTLLAADSSPSDRLIISGGTASGVTFLNITNTVGLGAVTTGSGILVVDAINGAMTDDAFRLAGPVVAGPFEYMLVKGNGNPEAWYLRSTLLPFPPEPPFPPFPPGPIPPGVIPPAQPIPNFRQEVSLYTALPSLALLYGRALVDTLHRRMGGDMRFPAVVGLKDEPAIAGHRTTGAWGRVIGQTGDYDGGRLGIYGDTGPDFDFDFAAVQLGLDVYRSQWADGSRHNAGLYAAFGSGWSDVDHFTGRKAGENSFDAYSIGGYWTYHGPSGWYLDGVLNGTWYDAEAQSTRFPEEEPSGFGFTASLESGVPWRLGGFLVEPQAQLVYQTIDLDDFTDTGAFVRFDEVDGLAGRLGVRFAHTWAMGLWGAEPTVVTTWFRPNYWYEFLGNPTTEFSAEGGFIPFESDLGGSWVELNSGMSTELSPTSTIYVNSSYNIGLNRDLDSWDGQIGIKVNW